VFSFGDDICLDMHVIDSIPHGFYDEGGTIVGMDFEVLQQIESYSGVCMTKRLMPIARIWKSIEQGQHDGGLIFKSAARSHLVKYIAFIRNADIVVIPRKGVNIEHYEQLYKISIAKTRGTSISNRFDLDKKLRFFDVTNYGQLIRMLRLGRVDAVVGSSEPLYYHLSKFEIKSKSVISGKKFTLGTREKWLQFSNKSANLDQTSRLKKAADLMIKNGDYDRIMMKYYGRTVEQMNPAK
jgi:polar amino acid transport system substrate-binding protein